MAADRGFGLDLVRALAILLVLFAHDAAFLGAWLGFPVPLAVSLAGMFGVELFFVLSGLLIGRLLFDLVEYGPSLRNLGIFLVRRWMRTLPLYYVWLALLLVVRPPLDWGWHAARYVTLTQNLFSGMPASGFFPVTWSLTIEEWFYLLFAAAAVGSVAVLRRPTGIWLAIGVFLIVPPALRWQVADTVDFMGGLEKVAVLRLDAIATGVVVAGLLRRWMPPLGLSLNLLASGLTVIWLAWTSNVPWPEHVFRSFVFNLILVGWALCLPAAVAWVRCDGWFGRGVRGLSRYAYGLYIVHFTVLEMVGDARAVLSPWGAAVVGIVAPFGLAVLSWRFLEAPILARRPSQAHSRGYAGRAVTAGALR
jgi:peptidoglycan/LPS O-acetylase OafA/YrhL